MKLSVVFLFKVSDAKIMIRRRLIILLSRMVVKARYRCGWWKPAKGYRMS